MTNSQASLLAALTKQSDKIREDLTAEEEEAAKELLSARAEKELGHLPGTVADRAALLRAIDGIEDEAQRKAALNAIKMPDGLASETMLAGPSNAELDSLAKAYQAANPGVSIEVAHVAILATAKGKELYAKSLN